MLDPALRLPSWPGVAGALAALLLLRRAGSGESWTVFLVLLTAVFAV